MCNCKQLLISVIVCVYNMEKYIGKCLESISAQTYTNLEIIVINDGSTDESGTIVKEWQEKDERIVSVYQKKQGLAAARNVGISISRGEYIGFVDADDYIEKEMYKILYDAIIQSECSIAMCSYKKIDVNGKIIEKNAENPKSQIYDAEKIFSLAITNRTYYGMCVCTWNKLYNKNLFDKLRYPVERLHEDNWLIHKLVYRAGKIIFVDKELYYYRQIENSIMHRPFSLKSFDNYFAQVDRTVFLEKNQASQELVNQWKADCVKFGISYWFQMKDSKCGTRADEKKFYKAIKNSIKDYVKVCSLPLRIKAILFFRAPRLYFWLHHMKQNK